jgi:hypothetical protein
MENDFDLKDIYNIVIEPEHSKNTLKKIMKNKNLDLITTLNILITKDYNKFNISKEEYKELKHYFLIFINSEGNLNKL